jgi:hypothetical protein
MTELVLPGNDLDSDGEASVPPSEAVSLLQVRPIPKDGWVGGRLRAAQGIGRSALGVPGLDIERTKAVSQPASGRPFAAGT